VDSQSSTHTKQTFFVLPLLIIAALALVALLQEPDYGLRGRYFSLDEVTPRLCFSRIDSRLNFTDKPLRSLFPESRRYKIVWEGWIYLSESLGPDDLDYGNHNQNNLKIDGAPLGEKQITPGYHQLRLETINNGRGLRDALRFCYQSGGKLCEPHAWDLWPGSTPPSRNLLCARILLAKAGRIALLLATVWLIASFLAHALPKWTASRRGCIIIALSLFALAVMFRTAVLINSQAMVESDEAALGLLAKHIADGTSFPVFLGGQPYQGSLEAFFIAALFRVFGVSCWTLKLWPLLCSSLLAIVVFYLIRKMLDGTAACFAALYLALSPAFLTEMSLKAWIGYSSNALMCASILLLTWKMMGRGKSEKAMFCLGILMGAAFWIHFQCAPILLFCVALLIWDEPKLPLKFPFWLLVLGGLLAAMPVWIYNLNHNWESFRFLSHGVSAGANVGDFKDNLGRMFLMQTIPTLAGMRPRWRWSEPDSFLGGLPAVLVYAILFIGITLFAYHAAKRAGFVAFWKKPHPALTIILLALLIPLVGAASNFGPAPIYCLFLYVIIPGAVFVGLNSLKRYHHALPGALFLLLIFQNVHGSLATPSILTFQAQQKVYTGQLLPLSNDKLIDALEEKGITRLNAAYWIGHRLTFDSTERVIATYALDRRYPEHFQQLRSSESVGYLFHANYFYVDGYHRYLFETMQSIKQVDALFKQIGYSRLDSGAYRVYYPPTSHPSGGKCYWKLKSSAGDNLASACDNDLYSAFHTPPLENGAGWITIDLGGSANLTGVLLSYGRLIDQVPRQAEVRFSEDGENWSGGGNMLWNEASGSMIFENGATTSARYLRIKGWPRTAGKPWWILEIFVY
jgi:Dolichyl-phosphate-mannose-protein mannosyltransferase/F5/8 type C domain